MKKTKSCEECRFFKDNDCALGHESPVITYDENGVEYCFDKSPGSAYHAKPNQTGRKIIERAAKTTESLTCWHGDIHDTGF